MLSRSFNLARRFAPTMQKRTEMMTTMYSRRIDAHCRQHPKSLFRVWYSDDLGVWCIGHATDALAVPIRVLSAYKRERECWRRLQQLGCMRQSRYLWLLIGNQHNKCALGKAA